MHEAESRKTDQTERRTLLFIVAVFVVVVAIGVAVFLRFYNSYMDGILYRERLSQMEEVTTQLFSGLEDVVQTQWERTDTFCSYLETGKPADDETLLIFMKKQAALNKLDERGAHLIAVDDLGRYLTEEGWQGTLSEMNLLAAEPELISFVSKPMTSNETYMNFLQRLEEPVTIQSGDRTVHLIYYGISQEMEQLNPYFTCKAYDNSNSVYVLDKQGMRLFRSSSSNLLQGYNAYATLEQMEYLHGNSFSEAKKELDSTGYGYANAVLDGEEYYYAMYQMDHAEWILLFLVPSSYVATDVVTMVNTTVKLIMVFAVVMLAAFSMVLFLILRFKQRQALQAERQNNAQLERMNGELKEAVRVAEKATKAKSEFLSNMSHDIRTPMNAIVGITNLMAHETDTSDKMHTYIEKVRMSSRHLLSLINDILDMSKIESSEVTLNQDSISLAEQVGQVDSIIRAQTNERGQTFHIRAHTVAHEYLIGDPIRLRQIFLNLLSNAVKYTPYGGRIDFDLAEVPCSIPEHAAFRITVKDNGYGMSPEFVTHIFEPFTRAENSMTNKVQGTGLGMAITKNIVDLMGGTITVQSEEGKGSCFEVMLTFPIDRNADMTTDLGAALLISDDDVLRNNMAASMREVNVRFYTVSTKEEAAKLMETQKMDIVLVGGHLSDEGLPEKVAMLRRAAGDAIFIFFVDYVTPEQIGETVSEIGADGLIPRPFFLSNLLRTIERIRSADTSADEKRSVLNGLHFLCAEDNDLNAEILEAILGMNGASCVIYPNGRELVKAFESVRPGDYDAILMDVQMPVMNGLEAARVLRGGENPLGRTIPIIAMTANAFTEDIQQCLDAGMDAHVAKPLDVAVLERTLRGLKVGNAVGGGSSSQDGSGE